MLSLLPCTGMASSSSRFLVSFITTILSIMFVLLIVTVSMSWASPDRRTSNDQQQQQPQLPLVSYPHSKDSSSSSSSIVSSSSSDPSSSSFYMPSMESRSESQYGDHNTDNQQLTNSIQGSSASTPYDQSMDSMESNFDQVRRSFQTSHEQYSDILGLMMKDLEQRIQQQQQQQQQQSVPLQQQQSGLVTPSNRLSNLGAFASMSGGSAGALGGGSLFGEDPAKLGANPNDALMNSMSASSTNAALQYARPGMMGAPGLGPGMGAPGMMPGMGSGMSPGMGPGMGVPGMMPGMFPFMAPPPFGSRRNTLLNPFGNPAFGSEYPFFPYNPVFSKLHTNPYLFSYMPYYPAPYGPGRYFQRQQESSTQQQLQPQPTKLQEESPLTSASNPPGPLTNTLMAVANLLGGASTENENYLDRSFETLAPGGASNSPVANIAAALLSLLDPASLDEENFRKK